MKTTYNWFNLIKLQIFNNLKTCQNIAQKRAPKFHIIISITGQAHPLTRNLIFNEITNTIIRRSKQVIFWVSLPDKD